MEKIQIELACDHVEGDEFCDWLNGLGYEAHVGPTTGNFYDRRRCEGRELESLWDEYCLS